MSDVWTKICSFDINAEFVTVGEGAAAAVINKELVETLLLKKLQEIQPGRYIVRNTYWGKVKTTIRFAKHNPCLKQWKFSAATEEMESGKATFELHENEGVCTHESPAFARALPPKGIY